MPELMIRQTTRWGLAEFRPGDVVNIWGLQPAFVLGRSDFPADDGSMGCLDLMWVDSIGIIVIMPYTLDQVRLMVASKGITRKGSI